MPNPELVGLASILVLGIAAQVVAARLRVPAILPLLGTGIVAGPVLGLLHPDRLFGDLLLPGVSIAVAIILYDGGLTLQVRELRRGGGGVVSRLVTVGAVVTWLVSALAAHWVLGLDVRMAVLLGAVLVVTGPTVILPMLRHIRPAGRVASILKWEGIVIDPIGALLAVLVFEVVFHRNFAEGPAYTGWLVARTVLVGGGMGVAAAALLVVLLRYYWVPDYLQNPLSLALAVGAFTLSNSLQAESGLFAVTLMGMALANQRFANVQHIAEFKENLGVLLIGALFILLGARLTWDQLRAVDWRVAAFVAVLVLVARPLAVWLSTLGSDLKWREKVFLMTLAPRGIVAAAVSSVFALELAKASFAGGETLVVATFAVIVGTVGFYGLLAPLAAYRLRLATPEPQGLLIAGADGWQRAVGRVLREQGYRVLLVDTNPVHVAAARMAGLEAWSGSILAEDMLEHVDLGGIGRFLALTPNDWVNDRAAERFARVFGKAGVYQLPSKDEARGTDPQHGLIRGRPLFGENMTCRLLEERFATGAVVKATRLSKQFNYRAYLERYTAAATPLFIIHESGQLEVVTVEASPSPAAGHTVVSLVDREHAEAV